MLYAGLDVHKDFVQACFVDEEGKIARESKYTTSVAGLHRLCQQAKDAKCVLEASTSCLPVFDALQAQGVSVRVAHPLKVKAIASAKLKTDKVDARMLAQLERADLIPESHVPDKPTRELKQLVRQHMSLTEERTTIKNQVHALLVKNGVHPPFKSLFTKRTRAWLKINTAGVLSLALEQSFERIETLDKQRNVIDSEIIKKAEANPDAMLLKTIPGVGWFSALLLAVEIDGVERFVDEEHLQSYAGLTPSTRQSGNTTRSGHISKQGNPIIRWALVQDAWIAVNHSKRFKKTFTRFKKRHKNVNVAIIAVARKMLRCAYFMLSRRQAFSENA